MPRPDSYIHIRTYTTYRYVKLITPKGLSSLIVKNKSRKYIINLILQKITIILSYLSNISVIILLLLTYFFPSIKIKQYTTQQVVIKRSLAVKQVRSKARGRF